MGLKENIDREKQSLMSTRRPYETAAFIIFSLLFLQQMFYLIRSLYLFAKNKTFFSLTNITSTGNLQAFFNRTVVIDSTKWIWVILAVAFLALYYFLIYVFVWRYCKRRNLAKWTWTTLVVFGPALFFMPAYMFYIIYIFREYFFKFIKTVVEEYKGFDINKMSIQEAQILEQEEKEALERVKEKEIKEKEKEEEKKKKEAEKDNKVEE